MSVMSRLVQKVDWDMPNSKPCQMYMYGEASFEANQQMQEPLEKLYNYENSLDEYEALSRYLSKLEKKINYELGRMRDLAWGDSYVECLRNRVASFEEVREDLKQLMTDLKKQKEG